GLLSFAVLAVYERRPTELRDGGEHAAQHVLVLVLGEAPGEVVQEHTIAVDEEDLLDQGPPAAVDDEEDYFFQPGHGERDPHVRHGIREDPQGRVDAGVPDDGAHAVRVFGLEHAPKYDPA